ncbi:toll-like receptor 1 [Eublepharis macularius]|uniref:Toll-like receptor 1 n=1 Tax=Eublepharis macularius TaxID=481883 RepID=A0AA97JZ12_EUBMA|nr:toll-like receptor 1 [Eublepharis macularius]
MAKSRSPAASNSGAVFIFITAFLKNIPLTEETGFSTVRSNRFLNKVPKNLSAQTTVLDLSHNNISELHISDFSSILRLQVLNLAHNIIQDLDFSVFWYNVDLEYLDLSHNVLRTLSCHPVLSLRHLDLTGNHYTDMPVCPETNMPKLQYLGLSARRIQGSALSALTNIRLDTLLLSLEDLYEYRAKSIPQFNTKTIQIVFPANKDVRILRDLELGTTESLELSNIHGEQVNELRTFLLSRNGGLLNLTLNNMQCSWEEFISILQAAWETTIEHLVISNATQMDATNADNFNHTKTSLKTLIVRQTVITSIKSDPQHMYRIFSEMNITALTISGAKLIHMLCPSKPSHFTYLCFSYNILTDAVFENCNTLTLLEMLILRVNQLKNLIKVSSMTCHMKSLKYLDMSQNLLQYEDHEKGCSWGENLVELNLSSNLLSDSVFHCLPVNIQKLDLQSNQISSIPKEMVELRALEELNLASNRLTDLPGCGQFSSLRLLNAEMNSIFTPSSEFYHTCQSIREVKAEHNPFMCSCELRVFINLRKQGMVELVGWPESYLCEYPEYLRGIQLKDFHISELVCNTTLLVAVVLVILVVFAVIISFLCVYLDVPWYLKMMWQWTQVKHRVWKNKPEDIHDNIIFHAFISYSERDSDWVKNVLIPNLEKEDGSIRLCQHERNFIAGKSIVENIIDCIEKSYRSIFVLSPNFVQSEWCHYELYFAHHKLFRENTNNLILLLLEPIPTHIIPVRYHKLKALMAKRTYLEWPAEKNKHGLFWANLRAAIYIQLPEK